MIEWVGEWLKQIIIVVVIATCLDLLLPNQSMERYVKLVMGLIIVIVILTPIYQLFKDKFQFALPAVEQAWFNKSDYSEIKVRTEQVQEQQRALVRQETEHKLQQTMSKELAKKFSLDVMETAVELEGNPEQAKIKQLRLITRVRVVEKNPGLAEINPIRSVQVMISDFSPASQKSREQKLTSEIVAYLQQKWKIKPEQVVILWEPSESLR